MAQPATPRGHEVHKKRIASERRNGTGVLMSWRKFDAKRLRVDCSK